MVHLMIKDMYTLHPTKLNGGNLRAIPSLPSSILTYLFRPLAGHIQQQQQRHTAAQPYFNNAPDVPVPEFENNPHHSNTKASYYPPAYSQPQSVQPPPTQQYNMYQSPRNAASVKQAPVSEKPSNFGTFDRDSPLFERLVPVTVQEYGVEEKTRMLMIRVLASNGTYNTDGGVKSVNDTSRKRAQSSTFHLPASTNCVRVEVTDDRDHFFLHTLEVGERAFHELKQQQRMVIDFTAFAGKLIEMLNYCCSQEKEDEGAGDDSVTSGGKAASSQPSPSIQFGPGFMGAHHEVHNLATDTGGGQHSHSCRQREASMSGHPPPRFTSVLKSGHGGSSVFNIIEVNSFNHVTHLSLNLKPADDVDIKYYLSARLSQFIDLNNQNATRLRATTEELHTTSSKLDVAHRTLEQFQTQNSAQVQAMQNDHEAALNLLRKNMMEEMRQAQVSHGELVKELEQRHDAMSHELQQNLSTATQKNVDDLKRILELESGHRDLTEKIRLNETSHALDKQELASLRSENQSGGTVRFHQEKEIGESRLRIAAMQQQIEDKEAVIQNMKELLETTGEQKMVNERSLEMYKAEKEKQQRKLEAAVKEINKGNQAIDEVHAKCSSLRQRSKSQTEVVRQQEERLKQNADLIKDLKSASRQAEIIASNREEKMKAMEEKAKACQGKLSEAQEQLTRNEQTVRHLSKELNDTRAGRNQSVAQHIAYQSAHTFTPSVKYQQSQAQPQQSHLPKYMPAPTALGDNKEPYSALGGNTKQRYSALEDPKQPYSSGSGFGMEFAASYKQPERKANGEDLPSYPSYTRGLGLPLQSEFLSHPAPEKERPSYFAAPVLKS
jgi:spindle assembly abnormal protein 6